MAIPLVRLATRLQGLSNHLACLGACVIAFTGCAFSQQSGKLTRQKNADQILSIVQQKYPQGATVADANSFMTDEGFECTYKESESFREEKVNVDGSMSRDDHDNFDYLLCVRRTQSGAVTTVFAVALVIEDGKVARAFESTQHTGP
jgi:hypothetical protein